MTDKNTYFCSSTVIQAHMDRLKTYTDSRGSLTIVEEGHEVPFKIQRVYWIHNVPCGEERGKHSNKVSWEYVVAVSGSVEITLEDKNGRETYLLNSKDKGLLIPPDTWDEIRNFSPGAILLVLASHAYDESAYINSYEEFLQYIGKNQI